jgi:signal transduction histidine kinase
VKYTSWRPFEEHDADAWWLALDYLRGVDEELKKVDALLYDLDRPRFEGRAVAGVDSPKRFAEHFRVRGWSPVDARIAVSDVPHLVETLGGEQLYGKDPEVALRELLQNAQDATVARKALDPDFTDDEIAVTLTEVDGTWTLEVTDRGVGMDEDILTTAVVDLCRRRGQRFFRWYQSIMGSTCRSTSSRSGRR